MSQNINPLSSIAWFGILLLSLSGAQASDTSAQDTQTSELISLDSLQVIDRTTPKASGNFDKKYCLRCHSMPTLGFRDPVTGGLVKLFVPDEGFRDSNHQALNCNDCHSAGFETYPHPSKAKAQSLYCVDCHAKNPNLIPEYFKKIEKEFQQSVHYQRMPEDFSCFSCHDAHFFKVSRKPTDPSRMPDREMCLSCHAETDFEIGGLQRDISEMVAYDNHICLDCHAQPNRITKLMSGDAPAPDLQTSHSWLPNVRMHWSKVRCIDCHLSPTDNYMHQILTADQAIDHCEDCHSANSLMLTKLYKYKAQESREKFGFMNSVALNEAYVIGMTRNVILDQISFLLLGVMAIGISAHGTARWLSNRRRKQ